MKSWIRIAYLFLLTLTVGMALVHLRTLRIQSVYRLVCLSEDEKQLCQVIGQQQEKLGAAIQSPVQMKTMIAELDLHLYSPGETPPLTHEAQLTRSEP